MIDPTVVGPITLTHLRLPALILGPLAGALLASAAPQQPSPRIAYDEPTITGELGSAAIDESSGLAVSRRDPRILWTCNDSGDKSRIFAIDTTGRLLHTVRVRGENVDWEDMASFESGGVSHLLIADVGNNATPRDVHEIYILAEPPVDHEETSVGETTLAPLRVIAFSYRDGQHDCEAVAVDVPAKKILLATKVWGLSCAVYELPLVLTGERADEPLVAQKVAEVTLPPVTAMDISPDGRRMIVLGYGNASAYERGAGESWTAALTRRPRTVRMPHRKQGEAICYGADGETLWLTSEGKHSPLQVIAPKPR